jgi:ATP-dependent Clp protease ATP-binding subunit ClpA
MPKINVYLPDELAAAVREARVPVSSICQTTLERAVRDVNALRSADRSPATEYEPGRPAKPFSRFTARARHAVVLAQQAANAVPHSYIGTEHLLLGILDEGENMALKVLALLDIEVDDLRVEIDAALGPATAPGPDPDHLPFTALLKSALEKAAHEALALGHNYIGCEHLLMGLLAEEQGLASTVLRRMGVDFRATKRTVIAALSGFGHARETPASGDDTTPAALAEILRRLEALERRLPS